MQSHSNIFIGIDVSKDELVVAHQVDKGWKKHKIPNIVERIGEWLEVCAGMWFE